MDMLEYQHWTRRTRKYGDEWSVYYPTMELAAEVGEIANLVKKIPRDDNNVLTTDDEIKLLKSLVMSSGRWRDCWTTVDLSLATSRSPTSTSSKRV